MALLEFLDSSCLVALLAIGGGRRGAGAGTRSSVVLLAVIASGQGQSEERSGTYCK